MYTNAQKIIRGQFWWYNEKPRMPNEIGASKSHQSSRGLREVSQLESGTISHFFVMSSINKLLLLMQECENTILSSLKRNPNWTKICN